MQLATGDAFGLTLKNGTALYCHVEDSGSVYAESEHFHGPLPYSADAFMTQGFLVTQARTPEAVLVHDKIMSALVTFTWKAGEGIEWTVHEDDEQTKGFVDWFLEQEAPEDRSILAAMKWVQCFDTQAIEWREVSG